MSIFVYDKPIRLKDDRYCDGCPFEYDTIRCTANGESLETETGSFNTIRPKECPLKSVTEMMTRINNAH